MTFYPPFFDKHTTIPAKLAFYQLKDGTKSVMLCSPWPDLQERCMRYVESWNQDFPDNPITFCAIQDVEFPK